MLGECCAFYRDLMLLKLQLLIKRQINSEVCKTINFTALRVISLQKTLILYLHLIAVFEARTIRISRMKHLCISFAYREQGYINI